MSKLTSKEPFYSITRPAGDLVFLSGHGPVDQDLNVVGETIQEQTVHTMEAIGRALKSEGLGFADLVRVNVFLLNMADRDGFNEAYYKFFEGGPVPTRRLVGAGDMFKGILVEIDGIAYIRYASEHHAFRSLEDFAQELMALRSRVPNLPNQRELFPD